MVSALHHSPLFLLFFSLFLCSQELLFLCPHLLQSCWSKHCKSAALPLIPVRFALLSPTPYGCFGAHSTDGASSAETHFALPALSLCVPCAPAPYCKLQLPPFPDPTMSSSICCPQWGLLLYCYSPTATYQDLPRRECYPSVSSVLLLRHPRLCSAACACGIWQLHFMLFVTLDLQGSQCITLVTYVCCRP